MARINIETSIYAELQFQELMIKVGDRHRAKGMLIELWTLAQQYWFPERKTIPQKEIQKAGLTPVIEAGLAEILEDGSVYARGTEEAFAWLFQKQAAGQASAEIKKRKIRARKPTPVEQPLTDAERTPTSLLSSPSSLLPTPNSEFYSVGQQASLLPSEGKSPAQVFIGVYCKAYGERYQDPKTGKRGRPDLSGKVQGNIGRYLNDVSLERACALIQTYLAMDDSWFMTKHHDFQTFVENQSKIGVQLDLGRTTTRAEIRGAEKKAGYQSQLERIAKGEL